MAKHDIVMPQMGESITNGTITKWHKKPGDVLEIDEILLEISTDKVESEIPSPFAGRIQEIRFTEGDTVDVGVVVAVIEDDLSAAPPKKEPPPPKPSSPPRSTPDMPPVSKPPPSPKKEVASRFYTPLVRALAREHGVPLEELNTLQGSGSGGRVNKNDFLTYLAQRSSGAAPPKQDKDEVTMIPMDSMRKTIARTMVTSKQTSPHVHSIDTVDMTSLVAFRESSKKDFEKQEGFPLTYTHFVLYALVQALKEFPSLNASIEGDHILLKKHIHLGCAVALPEGGLVVPVIKGAGELNLTGLARRLQTLVEKAHRKKLTVDDLSGGTYTLTNNGSFGVLMATPIILPPQLGIFCIGQIRKTPVIIEGDAMAIRQIMYATHTFDHRLIDGDEGAKFLKHVISTLETGDPKTFF